MSLESPLTVPILYSEVFGEKPTRESLRATIVKIDWHDVISFGSGIAAISWQLGIKNIAQQQACVEATIGGLPYAKRIADILSSDSARRLYVRDSLFGTQKVAVESGCAPGVDGSNRIDTVVTSILIVNELCAEELLPTAGVFGAAALVKSEVRSSVLALQHPHVSLARTESFIRWSGGKQALKDPDFFP